MTSISGMNGAMGGGIKNSASLGNLSLGAGSGSSSKNSNTALEELGESSVQTTFASKYDDLVKRAAFIAI